MLCAMPENIAIFSGDGDYIPLIEEIMRQGIETQVFAFSSGCNSQLRYVPDDFIEIDKYFLDSPEPAAKE